MQRLLRTSPVGRAPRLAATAAAVAGLAVAAAAHAQDAGGTAVLRDWPRRAGSWSVALVRDGPEGAPGCLALAGRAAPPEARFAFGLRRSGHRLELRIADPNARAGFGRVVTLAVDGEVVGRFPIAGARRPARGAPRQVTVAVPPGRAEAVLRSLRAGTVVRFATDVATYSASLAGAGAALDDLEECAARAADAGTAPAR